MTTKPWPKPVLVEEVAEQQPMLPKWVLQTGYGIDHACEFDPKQELVSRGFVMPTTGHLMGSYEMGTSLVKRQRRLKQFRGNHNLAEELPWALVQVDFGEFISAQVPQMDPCFMNSRPTRLFGAALANRHVPKNLEYFYFEVGIDAADGVVLGYVQLPTQHVALRKNKQREQGSSVTVDDEDIEFESSETSRYDPVFTGESSRDDSIPEQDASDEDMSSQAGSEAHSLYHEKYERAKETDIVDEWLTDLASEKHFEFLRAQYAAERTGLAEDDKSDLLKAIREQDRGDRLRLFRKRSVLYDRRPSMGIDDVVLAPTRFSPRYYAETYGQESGLAEAPSIQWDFRHFALLDTAHKITPLSYPCNSENRMGMVLDRVNNVAYIVVNGKLQPIEFECRFDPLRGDVFPFVIINSGKCHVYFGDGRKENDGFMYNFGDFVSRKTREFYEKHVVPSGKPDDDTMDSCFRAGLPDNPASDFDHCNRFVQEYLMRYGYDSDGKYLDDSFQKRSYLNELKRIKKMREDFINGEFSRIRRALLNSASEADGAAMDDVEFRLAIHEFVSLVRTAADSENGKESRKAAIDLGRHLSSRSLDADQRKLLSMAAAILITNEPRPDDIAYLYSAEWQTDLLRDILVRVHKCDMLWRKLGFQTAIEQLITSPRGEDIAKRSIAKVLGSWSTRDNPTKYDVWKW